MGSVANASRDEAVDQPQADQPNAGSPNVGSSHVEERRALIQRVAASANFRRSARLRDFLIYVGRESLKDPDREIHEQEIGAKVFGRSSNYDRSQDNIVRVNATELRKRIEMYFATEGAHEPLVLDIPRGAYKPIFHWRSPEAPPHAPQDKVDPPTVPAPAATPSSTDRIAETPRRPRAWAPFIWGIAVLALTVVCVVLSLQNRAMHRALYAWEGKPALAAFWGDFLRNRQRTDVVLADASLSIGEELTRHAISLPEYIDRRYMDEAGSLPVSKDRRDDLSDIYGHNLVAFGDFRAAQQILALSPVGSSLNLTLSRFFQAESVKRDNLILVGGKKANPWVYLFDEQMNFSLDYDDAQGQGYIANRHPNPGEAAIYNNSGYPNGFVGYSVVAYLPNPSHNANVIVLTGTDSDATTAAAEFLTSEEQLKKFQNSLHAKEFPYFEVLLKTSRLSGTSLNSEVLAYRTYPRVP